MHTVASRGHNCTNTVIKHPKTLFKIILLEWGGRRRYYKTSIEKKRWYFCIGALGQQCEVLTGSDCVNDLSDCILMNSWITMRLREQLYHNGGIKGWIIIFLSSSFFLAHKTLQKLDSKKMDSTPNRNTSDRWLPQKIYTFPRHKCL